MVDPLAREQRLRPVIMGFRFGDELLSVESLKLTDGELQPFRRVLVPQWCRLEERSRGLSREPGVNLL
jgi:hypothetical protein